MDVHMTMTLKEALLDAVAMTYALTGPEFVAARNRWLGALGMTEFQARILNEHAAESHRFTDNVEFVRFGPIDFDSIILPVVDSGNFTNG
jgi:hypothetical protein